MAEFWDKSKSIRVDNLIICPQDLMLVPIKTKITSKELGPQNIK